MEKPIRPLKPKLQEPHKPQKTNYDRYYVMRRHHASGPPTTQIMSEWAFPPLDATDGEEMEMAELFYSTCSYYDHITLAELLDFAEEKSIDPADLEVVTLEVDSYLTAIQLRHNTRLSDEEYNRRIETWAQEKQQAKEQHQEAVAQWRLDLEQYKQDKAAYEVYKAQQKLNALRGN